MNPLTQSEGRRTFPAILALILATTGTPAFAQQVSNTAEEQDDDIITLSPFEVSTSNDSGYYASNAISGTRINLALKDTPLTMEVLTSEFIDDTGALDLRESLRYSAGVILQSQNDALNPQQFQHPGGVHNPEASTANKNQTTIKMRGYITEASLRNGFRRQNATDSINIERVEVLRGPSALLYGVGNFGGIVNVIPKQPLAKEAFSVGATVGNHGLIRGELDYSTPLGGKLGETGSGLRITAVGEHGGDWTDRYKADNFFVSPIVVYRPSDRTKLTLDFEYGKKTEHGIGFQSLRLPPVDPTFVAQQQDRLEVMDFMTWPGKDQRTFRWSGDDTSLETEAGNFLAQIDQKLTEGLHLQAGYNYSFVNFDQRDIFAAAVQGQGPEELRDDVQTRRVTSSGEDPDAPIVRGVTTQYRWEDERTEERRHQVRIDLNYAVDLFQNSDWLAVKNNFMVGYMWEDLSRDRLKHQSDDWNYKRLTDSTYFTFGTQGSPNNPGAGGADYFMPDSPMSSLEEQHSSITNGGAYLVYQGRFLNDRLNIVAGARRDSTDNSDQVTNFRNSDLDSEVSADNSATTYQFGANFALTSGLSVYGVYAEGLTPNWNGYKDGWGNVLEPTKAKSREVGLKFELFDRKISGWISAFKIERTNVPQYFWFSPSPERGRFITNSDIIYRLDHYAANRTYVQNGDANEWWARPGDNLLLGTGDLRDILAQQNLSVDLDAYGTTHTIPNNDRASFLDTSMLTQQERQNLADALAIDARDTLGSGAIRGSASAQFDAAMATILDNDPNNDAILFSRPKSAADGTVADVWKAYIDLSTPQGAAVMDQVFVQTMPNQTQWPGWLFQSIYDADPRDLNINGAALDVATPDGGNTQANYTSVEDSSKGWEAEVLFTPIPNWQTRVTYSHVTRQLDKPGAFVSYPYDADDKYWDRWVPWYFPNASWGLTGRNAADQYPGGSGNYIGSDTPLPNKDTSTFVGYGYGVGQALDDTPAHVVSLWSNYSFTEGALQGWSVGLGGYWESARTWATQFTTAGQVKESPDGSGLEAKTDPRLTVNAMLRYAHDFENYRLSAQLNVDNLLNDTDRYGMIYAPGVSYRFRVGFDF